MKLIVLPALLLLGACASTGTAPEPQIVIKEVLVPIAQPCWPKGTSPEPDYVDSDDALRAAAGPEDRYQLTAAGRLQRNAYLNEIRPIRRACEE